MANNRLYLEDAETGERFLLAKSFAEGWIVYNDSLSIDLWLEGKDEGASVGRCMEDTQLRLVTENAS